MSSIGPLRLEFELPEDQILESNFRRAINEENKQILIKISEITKDDKEMISK